jgi:superkiller protein 3
MCFVRLAAACLVLASVGAFAEGDGPMAEAERLFTLGKWAKAAAAYEVALKEQASPDGLHRLAEAHLYAHNFGAARGAFKKALSLDKDDAYATSSLAMLKAIEKGGQGALDELLSLKEKYGDDYRYWRALGFASLQMGLDRVAIGYFEEAVKRNPEDYMSYFYTGIAYELHLDFDNAIAPYKRAVEINPMYAQAVNNLGYNYKERHYYAYAAEMYERALELDPGHAGYYYNIGNVYNHWDLRRAAFYMHSKSSELDPTFPKAHYNVGKNLIRFGFYEDAIVHLKLYLKYWNPSYSERDVPHPKVVKQMIEDVEDMMAERKERLAEVEQDKKRLEEIMKRRKEGAAR